MIIKDGNVVLNNSVEKKDILIENGKIVKIAENIRNCIIPLQRIRTALTS